MGRGFDQIPISNWPGKGEKPARGACLVKFSPRFSLLCISAQVIVSFHSNETWKLTWRISWKVSQGFKEKGGETREIGETRGAVRSKIELEA